MKLILSFFVLIPFLSLAQRGQFVCPMKKAKIVIEERGFNDGKRNPGAIIEGKNKKVYSCSSGIVKAIDTVNGRTVVYIEFENYSFSYHNFQSIVVVKGQTIKSGEMIGVIIKKERLFLIASKDNALVEPESILKCKVVHRYLK
ncbi:MAG: hypothetical protein BGO54_07200 [Sphingobacteriales bacterium 46-32]|nr:MAG: hypothetical protein BGO54_07200 [Sphingobacteriales bacterium 46-32]